MNKLEQEVKGYWKVGKTFRSRSSKRAVARRSRELTVEKALRTLSQILETSSSRRLRRHSDALLLDVISNSVDSGRKNEST